MHPSDTYRAKLWSTSPWQADARACCYTCSRSPGRVAAITWWGMELRHLRYFIAVAEHESVREASERLHVTQPAISRQIQDLEEMLEFPLFHRTSRGLKLTEAGTLFLKESRRTLEQLETAALNARLAAQGKQGQLRIGFVENAGWDGVLPDTFNQFQQSAPQVSIELAPMYTLAQLREIENGTLDGGFVYLFEAVSERFTSIPLLEHNVVLAVPRRWGMAADQAVDPRALSERPFITFRRPVYPLYYDKLIAACSRAGLTMNVVQEVSSESSILSLVSAGIGAAIVNSANRGRPPAQAQFLPIQAISVPLPLAFIHLKSNNNPALAHFIATLNLVRG
jgi:DNA-binding transcriptional LysR family regulator